MRLPFLSGGYSSRSRSEPGTVAFPRRKAWDLFWVRVESHEKESRTCDRKMRGRKMREGDTWPEPGKVNHSSALIFTNLRLAEISGDECSPQHLAGRRQVPKREALVGEGGIEISDLRMSLRDAGAVSRPPS